MKDQFRKHWNRFAVIKDCGRIPVSGGASEVEGALRKASCAYSVGRLIKQECEEGNIPKELCPPQWRPENDTAEVSVPSVSRTNQFEDSFEPIHQDRDVSHGLYYCPQCRSELSYGATKCSSCGVSIIWNGTNPKISHEKRAKVEDLVVESHSNGLSFSGE